jgi:tRNA (guanine37-N1)-methyltransferase
MRFDIITLFPEIFEFYFNHSILKKAREKGIIKIKVHNLRDFTTDKHKTVDDKPFGGGRGMIVKLEPVFKVVSSLTKFKIQNSKFKITNKNSKIILFTPRGKKFNQKMATEFAKLDRLVLICGRYEGVDERVAKYIADECLSIGDYVLMGGELPALVFIEAVARLVPGVIGKSELLKERITKEKGFREYPQYTRPEIFEPKKGVKWRVPKVLLSGNHKKIEEWRKKHSKVIE